MDFFDFFIFRYFKKFFNFRKSFKKIIALILLFLVLFFSFNNCFAAEVVSNSTYYDAYNTLYNIYDNIYANIIFRLEKTSKANRELICSYFTNSLYNNYICFGAGVDSPVFYDNWAPLTQTRINMRLYFVLDWSADGSQGRDYSYSDYANWLTLGNVSCTKIIYKPNTQAICFQSYNGGSFSSSNDVSSINNGTFTWTSKPNILYDYPTFFVEYLNNVRLGLDNTSILNQLEQMGDSLDNIDNSLSEMNDFLQNQETETISSQDLPSDNMQNITSSGFNNIFDMLYTAFTSNNTHPDMTFTIPFLNYTFSLYSKSFAQTIIDAGFGPLVDFIQAFYYFLVSRYIVKDISKYIDALKNGDVSKTETNIKADML